MFPKEVLHHRQGVIFDVWNRQFPSVFETLGGSVGEPPAEVASVRIVDVERSVDDIHETEKLFHSFHDDCWVPEEQISIHDVDL